MLRRLYDRIFAHFYDAGLRRTEEAGLRDRRRDLLKEASGDVLEIGSGTGANSDFYSAQWRSLTLTEPSAAMAKRLRERLAERSKRPVLLEAGAESLPVEDKSFDAAISTLVLCTVGDLEASLAEIQRVLRPGGKLLFIEHVRSSDAKTARWQDRLAPIWRRLGNGCNCNRDTLNAIERAGFEIKRVEHGRVPMAPELLAPLIQGVAIKPED